MGVEAVFIPKSIVHRLRIEAERRGLSLEGYLVELAIQNLDPQERAEEYVEAAHELLEQVREELREGDIRQAAEKAWGAAALAAKAYAAWREGKQLTRHGDLWEYTLILRRELGEWVSDSWAQANSMHTCLYEGWCSKEHVEDALKRIEKLVKTVREKIKRMVKPR